MSKTTNKFAPEVRERAVHIVLDHEGDHPPRWAAITSLAEKFGCSGHTLLEWVKKAEVTSGKRAGVSTEAADKLKALSARTASYARPTSTCARHLHILPGQSPTARSSDDCVHRRASR